MNKFIIAAAVVSMAGAAHAQEAFITQLGDDNVAANVAVGGGNIGNTQVIAQEGNNLAAANLTRGFDNSAYAYQIMRPAQGFFVFPDAAQPTAQSLIWQTEGTGGVASGNNAVNVQLHEGVVPVPLAYFNTASYVAQTIQAGDDNTAVNWQQDGNVSAVPLFGGSISAPTLSLSPNTTSPSTPFVSTGIPYSGSLQIN